MANISMPNGGFCVSVDPGEEATVEPIKADLLFLKEQIEEVLLMGTGRGFKLYLVPAEATQAYQVDRWWHRSPPEESVWLQFRTPPHLDGLQVHQVLLSWQMKLHEESRSRLYLEISTNETDWSSAIIDIDWNDYFWRHTKGMIHLSQFPLFLRIRTGVFQWEYSNIMGLHLSNCYLEGSIL